MEYIKQVTRKVKKHLREIGIPYSAINSIETRSLRSGRRLTGDFKSNRQNRWLLLANDPQYGNEKQCRLIFLKLIHQFMCFEGAPKFNFGLTNFLNLEKKLYKDPLTLERLNYGNFIEEIVSPNHGMSNFHIGHMNPKLTPKHTFDNVNWMTKRSNLIQSELTLEEAKNYILNISYNLIYENNMVP